MKSTIDKYQHFHGQEKSKVNTPINKESENYEHLLQNYKDRSGNLA